MLLLFSSWGNSRFFPAATRPDDILVRWGHRGRSSGRGLGDLGRPHPPWLASSFVVLPSIDFCVDTVQILGNTTDIKSERIIFWARLTLKKHIPFICQEQTCQMIKVWFVKCVKVWFKTKTNIECFAFEHATK